MAEFNRIAATNLLAQLLTAIPHTGGEDDPTFSMSEITSAGDAVETVVHLDSGDAYRVRVEWLRDQSP